MEPEIRTAINFLIFSTDTLKPSWYSITQPATMNFLTNLKSSILIFAKQVTDIFIVDL